MLPSLAVYAPNNLGTIQKGNNMTLKASENLRDFTEVHSDATIEAIEKVAEFTKDIKGHNFVTLANETFTTKSIASIHFDDDMHIDVSSGQPEIDWEDLNLLTHAEKLKFIRQMAKSIMGVTDALDRLARGFYNTLTQLEDVERNMLGKDKKETSH